MEFLPILFRFMALALVLLLSAHLLAIQKTKITILLLALLFCFSSYLLIPTIHLLQQPFPWVWVAAYFSNFIPAIIWLLAIYLSHDSTLIPRWFYVVTCLYLLLMMFPTNLDVLSGLSKAFKQVTFFYTPQIIKLALVAHAMYYVIMDRQIDLIESRRRLRIPIVLVTAGSVALVIVVELGLGGRSVLLVETLGAILLFLLIFVLCLGLFKLTSILQLLLQDTVVKPLTEVNKAVEDPVLTRIVNLVENDGLFRQTGITLDNLASKASVPIYRARNVINQQLGYRNFNQFINHYRISEASSCLLSKPELPILTIALDVGFSSLSSFNKAFKEAHGLTPSEYRLTAENKHS